MHLQRDVNVVGFSESDQANLWQNVTDAQSKSKQGLGQGSALKLPRNERWQGKKTNLDDSDEDDTDVLEGPPEQAVVEIEDREAVILPSKRTQEALLAGASGESLAWPWHKAALQQAQMISPGVAKARLADSEIFMAYIICLRSCAVHFAFHYRPDEL